MVLKCALASVPDKEENPTVGSDWILPITEDLDFGLVDCKHDIIQSGMIWYPILGVDDNHWPLNQRISLWTKTLRGKSQTTFTLWVLLAKNTGILFGTLTVAKMTSSNTLLNIIHKRKSILCGLFRRHFGEFLYGKLQDLAKSRPYLHSKPCWWKKWHFVGEKISTISKKNKKQKLWWHLSIIW